MDKFGLKAFFLSGIDIISSRKAYISEIKVFFTSGIGIFSEMCLFGIKSITSTYLLFS